MGPLKAPTGATKAFAISNLASRRLAYYKAESGPGVLAPRGWHCFGTYGSSGSSVYVTPVPIHPGIFFSDEWKGLTGNAIQLSVSYGGTSGRFEVARIISRVFPKHMDFVKNVIAEGIETANDFPAGPFPGDTLNYKSNDIVEFQTPANGSGLGTESRLLKNDHPIEGVAILVGEDTDLIQAAIRIPTKDIDLVPLIVHQVEHEATATRN